jgi:hypothetical integral membrane protein (TIGR02206 family)
MALENYFQPFGTAHFAIIAVVPAAATGLAALGRRRPAAGKPIRLALAAGLAAASAAYFVRFPLMGVPLYPEHLPLDLCDVSVWLTILVLLTRSAGLFDVVYYWAMAGATMSLLTPNLREPSMAMQVQYFADHGLIVAATLYLVWSGEARPRPGSIMRSMIALNAFAAFAGAFNWVYKTNYMYLCVKPEADTLLSICGPWPWYILSGEGVAAALFLLLYLPFRHGNKRIWAKVSPGATTIDGGK